MYVSEFTYRPAGSNTEVYTGGSAKTNMRVKTRVQWVSSNGTPAPSEVKLMLWSQTSAADPTPNGRGVSNGLGHPATESPERPGRTIKQSNGKRYRKFKVDGSGKVEFTTSVYAEVVISGTGGSGVENCSFSVTPTDWAVSLDYDKATYHRETDANGVGLAVANVNSGDGKVYSDTIAPWNFPQDLNPVLSGGLVPSLAGVWSGTFTSWNWTLPSYVTFSPSTPATSGTLPTAPQQASFTKGEAFGATTLVDLLVSSLSASDQSSGISDDCTLSVRVHPLRESLGKIRDHVKFGGNFLHNDEDEKVRAKYDFILLGFRDNDSDAADSKAFTIQSERSYEQGYHYEKSQQGGADLGPSEIATLKILFDWSETQSTLSSVGLTYGETLTLSLQARRRTSWAICYNGNASDWGTSKWNTNGFAGDTEVVIVKDVVPAEGKYISPVGVAWDGVV